MKKTALLFDLDGTLTDSKEGIVKCVVESLKPIGITAAPASLLGFIGPPLTWSYPHYFGLNEEETEQAVARFQTRYATVGKFENRVYAGIPETLAALCARGYRLAVATSKPHRFAKEIIAHFDLARYFEAVQGADMEEHSCKADVIRLVLAEMGVSPDDAVMIGDRRYDMEGAGQTGVDAVGVLWGYGSREELTASGAAEVLSTPEELLTLFP